MAGWSIDPSCPLCLAALTSLLYPAPPPLLLLCPSLSDSQSSATDQPAGQHKETNRSRTDRSNQTDRQPIGARQPQVEVEDQQREERGMRATRCSLPTARPIQQRTSSETMQPEERTIWPSRSQPKARHRPWTSHSTSLPALSVHSHENDGGDAIFALRCRCCWRGGRRSGAALLSVAQPGSGARENRESTGQLDECCFIVRTH